MKQEILDAIQSGNIESLNSFWKGDKKDFVSVMSETKGNQTLWEEILENEKSSDKAKRLIDVFHESGILGAGVIKNLFSKDGPAWLKILDNGNLNDEVVAYTLSKISKAEIKLLEQKGFDLLERSVLPLTWDKETPYRRAETLDVLSKKGYKFYNNPLFPEKMKNLLEKLSDPQSEKAKPVLVDVFNCSKENVSHSAFEFERLKELDGLSNNLDKDLFFKKLSEENPFTVDDETRRKFSKIYRSFSLKEKKTLATFLFENTDKWGDSINQSWEDRLLKENEIRSFVKEFAPKGRNINFGFLLKSYLDTDSKKISAWDMLDLLEKLSDNPKSGTFYLEEKIFPLLNTQSLLSKKGGSKTFLEHAYNNQSPKLERFLNYLASPRFLQNNLGIEGLNFSTSQSLSPRVTIRDKFGGSIVPQLKNASQEQKNIIKEILNQALFSHDNYRTEKYSFLGDKKGFWTERIADIVACGDDLSTPKQREELMKTFIENIYPYQIPLGYGADKISAIAKSLEHHFGVDWVKISQSLNDKIQKSLEDLPEDVDGGRKKFEDVLSFMEKKSLKKATVSDLVSEIQSLKNMVKKLSA